LLTPIWQELSFQRERRLTRSLFQCLVPLRCGCLSSRQAAARSACRLTR
jgi:hypothetical protein